MSLATPNRDGGRTSESGHLRAIQKVITGEVLTGLNVSQRSAGANMSVDVAIGDATIPRADGTYGHPAWNDAVYNQVIGTADVSNPRRDIVVMYIDYSVTPSTGVSNNTNGVVKISVVAGTPAGSPVDPSDAAIQSAVGASNPFIKLARVRVAAGATSITNSVIDDLRLMATGVEQGGWIYDDIYTWTYASSTSFTVAGVDVTSQFRVGTRISLYQSGTVKYFVVKSASFSTNTTVNLISAGDVASPYTLTNTPIDRPAFSYSATAQGFPGVIRRVIMQMSGDNGGGANDFNNYGREVKFVSGGTPSGFARGAVRVPRDWVAGTSVNLIIMVVENATQSLTWKYYIEGLDVGGDALTSPWNIASAASTPSQALTAKIAKEISVNVTSGNVAVDRLLAMAIRPDGTPSADIEVSAMVLEYTAYS